MEAKRFEILKANNKLPEDLVYQIETQNDMLQSKEDCTKHFMHMRNEFSENSVDTRDYPT